MPQDLHLQRPGPLRTATLALLTMLAALAMCTPVDAATRHPQRQHAALPLLAPLSAAVVARTRAPARVAFLGSSTTYGAGASRPSESYVALVLAGLQARHPSGTGSETTSFPLYSESGVLASWPGIQAFNGAVPGSTSLTYLSRRAEWALRRIRPACVVHMVGSNDSVAGVDPGDYGNRVLDAVRRIDHLARGPRPCHVLIHSVRRRGVSLERWSAFGAALQAVADRSPRITFLDVSGAFEVREALGTDPGDLISEDRVHPSTHGHALIASLLLDHLVEGIGTQRQLRALDTDGDGVPDRRELRLGTDPRRPESAR